MVLNRRESLREVLRDLHHNCTLRTVVALEGFEGFGGNPQFLEKGSRNPQFLEKD